MSNEEYIHKDSGEEQVLPESADIQADTAAHKRELTRRTVATALISVSVTFFLTLAIVIGAVSAFYLPLLKDTKPAGIYFQDDEATGTALAKLNKILDTVRSDYYLKLTDAQILEALSAGLPGALGNPYTYYLTSEQNAEIEEAMSGQYVGIGCTVTHTEQGATEIVEVMAGSPAEGAGLQTGDVLVKVDGEDVTNTVDVVQVVVKVKGEEGTEVKIEVFRPSTSKNIITTMKRRLIVMQNVKHRMLTADIGYVLIKGFIAGVDTDFKAAMDDLQSQGAKNVVFDLRYNSGGSASVMIEMLDYLLPKDTLLATIKGRENGSDFSVDWKTEKDMSVPESMEYMILVNSYSASASEFFSGCLRDHGKATIIGETTFGKGSGTSTFALDDGSAINLTIFQYYLPSGICIEGIGLEPDIEAVLPEEFKYTSIEVLTEDQDTVLQRAITEFGAE
ncbi:MAG: S41 family peptidase [Saccharofermentanales bacterium]